MQSRAGTEKEHKTTWANGEFEQQQSLEKEKADGTAGPSTSSQTRLVMMIGLYAIVAVWPMPSLPRWPPMSLLLSFPILIFESSFLF